MLEKTEYSEEELRISFGDLIDVLIQAPDRQLDDKLKPRLTALKNRPLPEIKDELLGIIDDCVFGSLTSGMVIRLLHNFWIHCGGTEKELQQRALLAIIENEK